MKCICGVNLFDCDIVESDIDWIDESLGIIDKVISQTYRCPKCFTVTHIEGSE